MNDNIEFVKDLNADINFALVKVYSTKKNKDYYALTATFHGKTCVILKFLTDKQKSDILEL